MRWLERGPGAHAARVLALALVLPLYGVARLPEVALAERDGLAGRFAFSRSVLPEAPGIPMHSVRSVSPSLQHIAPWVSAVGAGVALTDLDGDGLANDLCSVDTRTDAAIVQPVPGTGARYALFTLDPGPGLVDRARMAPMGCLPGDFDEDGRTDLLVYYWGRTPILFLRSGPAIAADAFTAQPLLPGDERWYTNAATQADLDGDGHLDLVLGNYYADGSHVLDATATTPDVVQDSMSRAFNGGGPRFLLWQGATHGPTPSATFALADAGLDEEVGHGWVLATGAADLDGDLLPELYLADDFGPDRLLANRSTPGALHFVPVEGQRTLTTPRSKVLGQDSFKGMGIDFADLNGDGVLDLFVSDIAAEYALEESNLLFLSTVPPERMHEQLEAGRAPYVERSEELGLSRSGWGWDARLADFDNDGSLEAIQATGFLRGERSRWPELHELAMSNDQLVHSPLSWLTLRPGDDLSGHDQNPFYVRTATGRFVQIASQLGLTEPGVSRGIAVADVDGDGRLDYAVANQWAPSSFYHNEAPAPGAFLGLRLRLPLGDDPAGDTQIDPAALASPSRPAIGATATLTLADGRRMVAEVDGGSGHSGKRSPEIHIGLGQLNQPVTVALAWRDAAGQPRHETVSLSPGWHTLLLGSSPGKGR